MGPGVLWEATMFAVFATAFSSLFIAFGVAAVVGHVLLIDLLLRSAPLQVAQQTPSAELSPVTR